MNDDIEIPSGPVSAPVAAGCRLQFSWGTGSQIRICEVFSPTSGTGGQNPYGIFESWATLTQERRKLAYDLVKPYKELRQALQRLGPGRQVESKQAIKTYSSEVLTIFSAASNETYSSPSPTPDQLRIAYEAGLWQLLELFFLSDDATEGFFAEAFAAWLGQHAGLFCSPPGFNPLLLEAERLLEAPRVDSDAAYWPTLQRLVLTGQLEIALQLLTAHPAYQALQDVDMAAKVEVLESVYQLLRTVPRFSRAGGSSSGRLAAVGTVIDRPAEFAAQRLAWRHKLEQLWVQRENAMADLKKLDASAAAGLAGVLCVLLAGSDNAQQGNTSYQFMISVAANWVELLTGLLLWKYPTLQPQLHLRQVAMKTRAAAGLSSTEHCDQDFLNFFEQLLLAASDQEVQSVISMCTSSDYCSQQFVAHVYDVLRGLPGADRVISRPLSSLGGDQSEMYTLLYAESLMVQACSWQLAAEYLAWCPVHGADALEMLIETSPFPLQDDRTAYKALALAHRHGLTSAAQGLCRRLGMAAAQSGRLAAALQWWVRAHDPARCAELVTPLVLKVQQQLLQQADSYQAVPLDVPELYDLEPLLLNLPSQSGLGELPALFNHDQQQLQHHAVKVGRPAQPRPYQELHFLRAFLQLQLALQALQQCQQQHRHQQQGMQKQPSGAALASAYAAVRLPAMELLLEGLAPAAVQLPLLLYLVPVLDSLYTPFTRTDVQGLMQVLLAATGPLPAAAGVLAGTHGSMNGLEWPVVDDDEKGTKSSRLHVRHVNDVRLALCRGLARGRVAESTSSLMVK